MNFDNYECDGQMTINEWMLDKSIEEKYPIPKPNDRNRALEGWSDDWHYCDIESPSEPDVYYGILLFGDCYIYTYIAWAKNKWWQWDSYKMEWKSVAHFNKPLAWTQIPVLYRQKDTSLHDKLGLRGII